MFSARVNVKYLIFSIFFLYFINQVCFPERSEKNNKTKTFFFLIARKVIKKNDSKLGRRNIIKLFLEKPDFTHIGKIGNNKKKIYNKFLLKSRKCNGYRNTRDGKEETVRKVKRILKVTKLLIQLNSFKLTPNLRMELLINMPRPHIRMHMVKNTLMELSVKNTQFEAITPHLTGSNTYFFIMNEDYISFSLYCNKLFSSIYKEYKTNNFIKMAIYENTILNKKETEDLINLKSYNVYFGHLANKINQIIATIPTSIMHIPSSIARGIYLHNKKKENM